MDYDTLDRLNVRQSRVRTSNSCIACSSADFESIVRAYGSMVYRLALVQTRNRADAEDVFQDVFVALVRRVARGGRGFESAEHVRAWLLRATVAVVVIWPVRPVASALKVSMSFLPNWPRAFFAVRPIRSVDLSSAKRRRRFGMQSASCRPSSVQSCTCFTSRD